MSFNCAPSGSIGFTSTVIPGRDANLQASASTLTFPSTLVGTTLVAQTAPIGKPATRPWGNHPLDSLAPMTWFEVPNSAVSASGEMYQYPSGMYFGSSPHIRFFDESGASYDSLRNRMVVFGGGHGDYAGNEIMIFDIDTLRWIRINDPSPRFDSLIERSGYYADANGNPDLQQPRSRHSYWSQIYVPTIDRYCAISAFGHLS